MMNIPELIAREELGLVREVKSILMMSQNKYKVAIIPAAGFGTRFSSDTPKQLFKLNDVSIIEKTISQLLN